MARVLCAVVLALASVCAAPAQQMPADQAQLLQTLSERVASLESRVGELEKENHDLQAKLASAPAVTAGGTSVAPGSVITPAPAPSPAAPAALAQMPMPMPQAEAPSYPNMQFHGFADVEFQSTDKKGQPQGFSLGQFVPHLSAALSPKASVFAELSLTAHPTGYTAEVERAIVRYDVNDYFKMSFGKYHTPISYWNTAFHHGAWLQTTISRPEMIQFGGRFLPVHFVGALAEGNIPSGSLGLKYNVGFGNGRQSVSLMGRDGDAGDTNSNRAWVANIFARPTSLYGLQVGGSVYRDLISPDSGSALHPQRELIASGHIVWTKERPEFIAEFANVRHTDTLTGQVWNSQGTYAQIAYRLPGAYKKWKPYYRYEYVHVPMTEPVLEFPNLSEHTVGARFDIVDFAALKVEYRHVRRPILQQINGLELVNGFFAQTAFTF